MITAIYLKSQQHFTTQGERDGSLAAALALESTADLQTAYMQERSSSAWSNPVFGGNARRWESAIANELLRRGVDSFFYRDIFGTRSITVRN